MHWCAVQVLLTFLCFLDPIPSLQWAPLTCWQLVLCEALTQESFKETNVSGHRSSLPLLYFVNPKIQKIIWFGSTRVDSGAAYEIN